MKRFPIFDLRHFSQEIERYEIKRLEIDFAIEIFCNSNLFQTKEH
jgi:hypothetical protein